MDSDPPSPQKCSSSPALLANLSSPSPAKPDGDASGQATPEQWDDHWVSVWPLPQLQEWPHMLQTRLEELQMQHPQQQSEAETVIEQRTFEVVNLIPTQQETQTWNDCEIHCPNTLKFQDEEKFQDKPDESQDQIEKTTSAERRIAELELQLEASRSLNKQLDATITELQKVTSPTTSVELGKDFGLPEELYTSCKRVKSPSHDVELPVRATTAVSPQLTPHKVEDMPTVFQLESKSLPLSEEPDTAEIPEVVRPKLKRQVNKPKSQKRRNPGVGTASKARRGKQLASQKNDPLDDLLLDHIPVNWQVHAKMPACSRWQTVLMILSSLAMCIAFMYSGTSNRTTLPIGSELGSAYEENSSSIATCENHSSNSIPVKGEKRPCERKSRARESAAKQTTPNGGRPATSATKQVKKKSKRSTVPATECPKKKVPDNAGEIVTTIGLLGKTDYKWWSGGMAKNGFIYGIPFSSRSVLKVDPITDTVTTFGDLGSTPLKWTSGKIAPNGAIYGIPASARNVLKIDPTNDTITTFGALDQGIAKWAHGVVGKNGAIYGIPSFSSAVLKIDPASDTVKTFGALGSARYKWMSGVLARNGAIYAVPSNMYSVLKIDPSTDEVQTLGALGNIENKWHTCIIANNGAIYGIPLSANSVVKVNPNSDTVTTFGNFGYTKHKWMSGVLAANGLIYGIPFSASTVLSINPTSDTVNTFGWVGTALNKWRSGQRASSGHIYGIPFHANSILKINPATNAVATFGALGTLRQKWRFSMVSKSGDIYAIPASATQVLKIRTPSKHLCERKKSVRCNQRGQSTDYPTPLWQT